MRMRGQDCEIYISLWNLFLLLPGMGFYIYLHKHHSHLNFFTRCQFTNILELAYAHCCTYIIFWAIVGSSRRSWLQLMRAQRVLGAMFQNLEERVKTVDTGLIYRTKLTLDLHRGYRECVPGIVFWSISETIWQIEIDNFRSIWSSRKMPSNNMKTYLYQEI